MRMAYQVFRGVMKSWDSLFAEAARFASALGPQRVVSISHSCDNVEGVVVVWYWDEPDGRGAPDLDAHLP